MVDRDWESEAKSQGWNADFDGANAVDAETFVRKGEEILPIVNAKNRELKDKVEMLTGRMDELQKGHQQYVQNARDEKAALIAQLEDTRKTAIDNNDGESFNEADRKINELRTAPQDTTPKRSPVTEAWIASGNDWYDNDPVLAEHADRLAEKLVQQKPYLYGKKELLDELTKVMHEAHPDKFKNSNRERQTVEDTNARKPSKAARSYDDLPQEAKDACDTFVTDIKGFTREQYVSSYQFEE